MPCVGLSCCPIALSRHVVSSCYFVVLFPHCLFATSLCCFIVMPLCVALCTVHCFVMLPCVLLCYFFCATSSCYFFTSWRCLIALLHNFDASCVASLPCCPALLPCLTTLPCCHHALPWLASIACYLASLPLRVASKYLLTPHHICCFNTLCLSISLLHCLVGWYFPPFFLQGGAWSLNKCVLQQLTIR